MDIEHPDKEIQKALKASVKEGTASSVMMTLMEFYSIPFALFLGATPRQVSILVALPQLIGVIFQAVSVHVVGHVKHRLATILTGIRLQVVILAFIGIISLLPRRYAVYAYLALLVGYGVINNVCGPLWGSLVSQYVSENQRGHYFGYRTRWVSMSGALSLVLWGVFLHYISDYSGILAFAALFSAAALSRFVSFRYMKQMVEVPADQSEDDQFTFWEFIARIKESNFVRYVLYVASITYATQIAAPLFSVYLIKEMGLGYLWYMTIHGCVVLGGFVSFKWWGRHADMLGNARILRFTGFLIALVPLFWIFCRDPVLLIPFEFIAGYVWGGFNLAAANFIYDAVSPAKRVRCLSYFNLINGVAFFLGNLTGGFLLRHMPPLFGSKFFTIFAISASLRFLSNFFISGQFNEIRKQVPKVDSVELFFSVLGIKPVIDRGMKPGI